jgi:hypothetical protein
MIGKEARFLNLYVLYGLLAGFTFSFGKHKMFDEAK